MSDFVSAMEKILKILHSITGFFVHPEKGGCCDARREDSSVVPTERNNN